MKTPKLRHHSAKGLAYARLGGRTYYFGKYGTEEAQQRFQHWLAEIDLRTDGTRSTTLLLLSARFMQHAKTHYRDADGNPTGEANNIRLALNVANSMFGNCFVGDFGPKKLIAVQQRMIEQQKSRNYINASIRRIRTVIRWGVAQQLVPPSVLLGLEAVPGLQAGRTEARETAPKQPVPELNYLAVETHVSRQVWGLLQFMRLTGCRPGEACLMRWCEIDAESDVWLYRPIRHKTQHRGKSRIIAIGPKAQAVLNQFGGSDADYVFRPQQAMDEMVGRICRDGAQARRVGEHYTTASLNNVVRAACRTAGVQHWSPNQLRHNAATDIRKRLSLDAAQVALGHADIKTTQRYAEQNIDAAIQYSRRFG